MRQVEQHCAGAPCVAVLTKVVLLVPVLVSFKSHELSAYAYWWLTGVAATDGNHISKWTLGSLLPSADASTKSDVDQHACEPLVVHVRFFSLADPKAGAFSFCFLVARSSDSLLAWCVAQRWRRHPSRLPPLSPTTAQLMPMPVLTVALALALALALVPALALTPTEATVVRRPTAQPHRGASTSLQPHLSSCGGQQWLLRL